MLTGSVLELDEVRGYGFIAPAAGGEGVFLPASLCDAGPHELTLGVRVDKKSESLPLTQIRKAATPNAMSHREGGDDKEGICGPLSRVESAGESTGLVHEDAPSLTGGRPPQARQGTPELAKKHGWSDIRTSGFPDDVRLKRRLGGSDGG